MSSALIRQALEFVDPEEKRGKRARRAGVARQRHQGQEHSANPYNRKSKKSVKEKTKSSEEIAEENVKKLLALSKPTADTKIAEKIVQRAIKGKPLLEKIEVKQEEDKPILFDEESFKQFEKQWFCS